jgi:hypothetical protein
MDYITISILIGLAIGILVSALFGVYSKSSADSYSRMFFGVSSHDMVFYLIIIVLIPTFILLTTLSVMIRDLWYPVNMPGNFTIETLLMGFLPAFVFLLMPLLRGYKYTSHTALEFVVLVFKFGILHILLQFSGFYSSLFPPLVKTSS